MRVEVQPLSPPRVGIDPLQIYPLVQEMAATGARVRVPVAVTCRVLGFSEQAYYQWLKQPRSAREIADNHLIGVLQELHEDDPEFGYRFLADELHALGYQTSERRVWRLCNLAGIASVITKRKPRYKKALPPVHDDLVQRDFTATGPNQCWPTDITEHWTKEGKLYLCAIKDVWSNKIVGYAIDDRMKASLAVRALENAVLQRGAPEGVVVHSDRGSQGGFNWLSQHPDDGGVQEWRRKIGPRKPVMRPRWCVGSGVRIGRYGPRCDLLVDRSLPGQFSASFGV
ncbi:transposase InsO family protein [Leucobacter exalbidus]|uniref:Transposase InsO family protein n=1 Tax=Leucobacter exalbidus TaxID=662960 RepID=A0A940T5X2_9MICO|nr:transposase InsO family protein [Leucobacter exalbidus]